MLGRPALAVSHEDTALYNLIVTAQEGAWEGRPQYGMPRDRFGEYTAEGLRARYQALDREALDALAALPALLAYEQGHRLPARVARITRFAASSRGEIRFAYEVIDGIAPVPDDLLRELAWDLDVGNNEMNRTHWAVKDVDLLQVLREAGVAGADTHGPWQVDRPAATGAERPVVAAPTVFTLPGEAPDPRLVAVMMPFQGFDAVYAALRVAIERAGLRCERADDVWEASTVMQDVFSLIYRSAVTIVDLTGRNSNVMYETGIAHTLGRPVVPIAQDLDGRLPFDLAHHRTLAYTADREGLAEMQVKLERRLRYLTRQ